MKKIKKCFVYRFGRSFVLKYYSKILEKKINKVISEINIPNKLKILNHKDRDLILKYYKGGFSKKERTSFNIDNLFYNKIKIGVFNEKKLISIFQVEIRGYNLVEIGFSTHKDYRRKGILKNLLNFFEDFLKRNKINYFAIVFKDNLNVKDYLLRRDYYIFKSENEIVYFKKINSKDSKTNLIKKIYYQSKKTFLKVLDEQIRNQFLTRNQIRKIQDEKFNNLLKHVYNNVPFYNKLYHKFNLKNIKSIKDILRLPIVNKSDLRKAFEEKSCLANNIPKKRFVSDKTSGSTNEPFEFFKDLNTEVIENACLIRQKLITGYKLGDASLLMRGFEPKKPFRRKIIEKLVRKRYFISLHHISEKTIPGYVNKIIDNKIKLIECFPSGLVEICKYIEANKIKVNVPYIISGGEKLKEIDKKIIEKSLGGKIYENYGAAETMEIAYQCELRNGFHIDSIRYLVEIVDDNGKLLPNGKEGNIIITDLDNYAMPFIRYKIGDLGIIGSKKCDCGRTFPIFKEIKGRIITNFHMMGGQILNYHLFSSILDEMYKYIEIYQVIKKADDLIYINLKVNNLFSDKIKDKILENFKTEIGDKIKIKINLVDKISRGRTGKIEMMRSEV